MSSFPCRKLCSFFLFYGKYLFLGVRQNTHLALFFCPLSYSFSLFQDEAEDDSDLSDYGDESDGKKDVLAEPFFMLIGEVFELRGSK